LRSVLKCVILSALAIGALAIPAFADEGVGPSDSARDINGIVPRADAPGEGASPYLGSGNLIYHNGPVLTTNKTYAIYWVPSGYSVSSAYQSLINRFFGDVAHDSGKTSDVYYSDTQYYGPTGKHIAYSSTFGGSAVDTKALPANGCTDRYTKVCLSDAQIRSEINSVATAHGWARANAVFFMFTAKGIGSCLSGGSCAFSTYCAYHSSFSASAGRTYYANMPYADTVPAACDAGNHPNNDDADATLNVTSHEHNEAITDPVGNAWYDSSGFENGDKCAWIFGTQLGGTTGHKYNQVINGHDYELQEEWSNKTSHCVLTGL
jgi:hypothetical protein